MLKVQKLIHKSLLVPVVVTVLYTVYSVQRRVNFGLF